MLNQQKTRTKEVNKYKKSLLNVGKTMSMLGLLITFVASGVSKQFGENQFGFLSFSFCLNKYDIDVSLA